MSANVIAFEPTKPKFDNRPYDDAIAGMKADPFFSPIIAAYGDDLGWDCLLYENGRGDLGWCDNRGLLFRMKLTAIDVHLYNLGQAEIPENDPEDAIETLRLDADQDAFVARFADYYATGHPILKEILAFALASRGTYGAWQFMTWILLWAEAKAGRPVEEITPPISA